MSIILSSKDVYAAFKELGERPQQQFLMSLREDGHLDGILSRATANAQQIQQKLREQITSLTSTIEQLKLARRRLTRKERKDRIVELSNDGCDHREIADQMTDEGEPYSPAAVRKVLSRFRRSK